MSVFILSKEAVKWEDMCRNVGLSLYEIAKRPRRVILDCVNHGDEIAAIQASTWLEARAKVDESKLDRIENQGWFA